MKFRSARLARMTLSQRFTLPLVVNRRVRSASLMLWMSRIALELIGHC